MALAHHHNNADLLQMLISRRCLLIRLIKIQNSLRRSLPAYLLYSLSLIPSSGCIKYNPILVFEDLRAAHLLSLIQIRMRTRPKDLISGVFHARGCFKIPEQVYWNQNGAI